MWDGFAKAKDCLSGFWYGLCPAGWFNTPKPPARGAGGLRTLTRNRRPLFVLGRVGYCVILHDFRKFEGIFGHLWL